MEARNLATGAEVPAGSTGLGALPGFAQVGIVVHDLEQGIRDYSALAGLSPWAIYTYGPGFVHDLTYRGRPASFSMRIALSGASPMVELVQPLEGPSIYHDWLEEHGEGLHHVGVEVPSLDGAVETATASGFSVIQSGRGYGLDGDGGFAYLDTYDRLRIIVELLEFPARRREPEAVR
jgi:methylmalonyl-CoA/ethylmalonyl-CoA epimerase